MERIHDLVREAHKTIDGMDGITEPFIEQAHAEREGSAEGTRGVPARRDTHFVVNASVVHVFDLPMICLATTAPEISAGGTPGPGTVSWPV